MSKNVSDGDTYFSQANQNALYDKKPETKTASHEAHVGTLKPAMSAGNPVAARTK